MSFVNFDIEQYYDEQFNRKLNESSNRRRHERRFDWRYFLFFSFFSNSCKYLLFIVSMFFLTFRNHSFDHFWFWDFFSERLCWENDLKDFLCWKCYREKYRFRRDRFRFSTNYFIKWNCDFESQRRKKSSKWVNFFCEKKLKWRRTTTFWCFFVVVV